MRVIIKRSRWLGTSLRPWVLACLILATLLLVGGASGFTAWYVRYSRLIDVRLQGPVFPNVSQIYAAPENLKLGQKISAAEVVSYLRRAGFSQRQGNPKGWYEWLPDGLRVVPGPESYFVQEPAELRFSEGRLNSIVSVKDLYARNEYLLEPLLVTSLFDRRREKRRLVSFTDLPPHLVNAILAIEDRRFFQHSGVDYLRILKAAYVDIRTGSVRQGASTLTMQLARSLFLTPHRTLKRKLSETLVAFQLERRLTKEQIFEYYCNKVYMGQRGSFSISGMGEAAQAYFRKEMSSLSLPEAAFLAGIIRGPNLYSPYRNPELARKRRDQVLAAMVEIGAITPEQREEAAAGPVQAAPPYTVASEAPYFVDMVKEQLLDQYSEEELASQSYRIYTTLDLNLQRAAADAVRVGLEEVDQRLQDMEKPRRRSKNGASTEAELTTRPVEVALIVLDPHTGAVKALIGGRNYAQSQLNRVLALRQPGSVFKPFVYAAALSASPYGSVGPPWTPASRINDEPTAFVFDGGVYEPANYNDKYYGRVPLRYALVRSLNVATVKLAQMVGYDAIVELARRSGLNMRIQPTPAVALGAYETTPLEIARAYTIFANQGVRMDSYWISMVQDRSGFVRERNRPRGVRVLDPRIAFLMTNLMEDVIQRGTGAGVRARGLTVPAAGKTGTSHDGWFAGYTSNLLAIVWVGYDSNRELPLSGAASALPIWVEFMKRATALSQYSDLQASTPPFGVVEVEIDPDTNELATPHCPRTQKEYFVAGTEPEQHCQLHYLQPLPQARPLAPIAKIPPPAVSEPVSPEPETAAVVVPASSPSLPASTPVVSEPSPPKRGFFGRLLGILRGGSDPDKETDP